LYSYVLKSFADSAATEPFPSYDTDIMACVCCIHFNSYYVPFYIPEPLKFNHSHALFI